MATTTSTQGLTPVYQFSPGEVRVAAQSNLDFFGGLAMPDDCTLSFPPYYTSLYSLLTESLVTERNFDKYAIGFPRGHGKTLFLKLIILYSILFTKKQFILVVCANQELAENIVRDVWEILDTDNIRGTFGYIKQAVQKDTGHFKKWTYDGVARMILAAGAGTSVRGLNIKNRRPDVIICDDVQTKECAASVAESTKFLKWFTGTLLKCKAPTGCTYIYVGNMYPDLVIRKEQEGELYACQLRNLQKNRFWKSFIVGAILQDTTSLWPELHPLEQLLEEYEQDISLGQGDVFCAEVLNDPQALPNAGLDFSKVYLHTPVAGELHQGNFIIIDPATGKKDSDDTAIGYFEVFDGKPVLVELIAEKLSSVQTVFTALKLGYRRNCFLIGAESVAYQAALLDWFNFVVAQQQMEGFEFVPLTPKGQSKNSRLRKMILAFIAGEIGVTNSVLAAVLHQIRMFNPLVTTNQDDIMDLLAYSQDMLTEYAAMLVIAGGSVALDYEFNLLPSSEEFEAGF